MPKYEVDLHGSYEVEADNKDDALDKALDLAARDAEVTEFDEDEDDECLEEEEEDEFDEEDTEAGR